MQLCVQWGFRRPYSCSLVLKYEAPLEDMLHCLLVLKHGAPPEDRLHCWQVLKNGAPLEDMLHCLLVLKYGDHWRTASTVLKHGAPLEDMFHCLLVLKYGEPLEDMLHCLEIWGTTGGHAPLFVGPEVWGTTGEEKLHSSTAEVCEQGQSKLLTNVEDERIVRGSKTSKDDLLLSLWWADMMSVFFSLYVNTLPA